MEKGANRNEDETKGDGAGNRLEFCGDIGKVDQDAQPHKCPKAPHAIIDLEVVGVTQAKHDHIQECYDGIILDG